LATVATPSLAQNKYPDRPVKIIVGFAPGGPTDIVARLIGSRLEKALGQPFVIENKPGGGSNIGSQEAARAKPDGYTLFLGTVANATNLSTYKKLNYDTLRDFIPISQLVSSPSILVANNDQPFKTLPELIAYAKANPGKLAYATSGAGGSPHLAAEMLNMRAGIDTLHVPYKGASPAMNDVIGGQVAIGFKTASGVTTTIQAGKLRAIAVSSPKRLDLLPDVPTLAESGVKGLENFEADQWYGLVAPAGTPAAVVQKMNQVVNANLSTPEVVARLKSEGATATPTSPEGFAQLIQREIKRWRPVVLNAKITAD
jgi:tripartite-type tricarboxylate transporter receptor subunit TctC